GGQGEGLGGGVLARRFPRRDQRGVGIAGETVRCPVRVCAGQAAAGAVPVLLVGQHDAERLGGGDRWQRLPARQRAAEVVADLVIVPARAGGEAGHAGVVRLAVRPRRDLIEIQRVAV